jgi:hypothetical protein
MKRRSIAASLATATLLAAATSARAGGLFLLGLVPYSYAKQPSADGRVVAGYDGQGAWYWTRETWVVRLDQSLSPGNGVVGLVWESGCNAYGFAWDSATGRPSTGSRSRPTGTSSRSG